MVTRQKADECLVRRTVRSAMAGLLTSVDGLSLFR